MKAVRSALLLITTLRKMYGWNRRAHSLQVDAQDDRRRLAPMRDSGLANEANTKSKTHRTSSGGRETNRRDMTGRGLRDM